MSGLRYVPHTNRFFSQTDAEFVGFLSRASHERDPSLGHAMAAGPDLLEALEALLQSVDLAGPRKLDEALTWRQNDDRVKAMVDAAIKKATAP